MGSGKSSTEGKNKQGCGCFACEPGSGCLPGGTKTDIFGSAVRMRRSRFYYGIETPVALDFDFTIGLFYGRIKKISFDRKRFPVGKKE